jgi:hypothetical protein
MLSTWQMSREILTHPLRIVVALWQKRVDISAALLPGGAIGILFRPVLPLIAVGLLAAMLSAGWRFAQPLFQLLPVYVLVPLGTVAMLAWLARRHSRMALGCAALLVAQALGWAIVWGPQVPAHWLRVSSPTAATLAKVRAQIPESDEVVASQGVLGPFSGRLDVHTLARTSRTPVSGTDVWFGRERCWPGAPSPRPPGVRPSPCPSTSRPPCAAASIPAGARSARASSRRIPASGSKSASGPTAATP